MVYRISLFYMLLFKAGLHWLISREMVYIGNRITETSFQSLRCLLGFSCLARSFLMKYQCTEEALATPQNGAQARSRKESLYLRIQNYYTDSKPTQ